MLKKFGRWTKNEAAYFLQVVEIIMINLEILGLNSYSNNVGHICFYKVIRISSFNIQQAILYLGVPLG